MPELRTLIDEVRTDLINGNPRRALAVCEHVLGRYPKHLEAHCLSAEALRELGDRKAARERFLRVLSADPENLIAYWGLSIIFEGEDQIEAAVWGVDAALSVHLGHRELVSEFFRLTGEAPSLDRASLARIRFRRGQYDLAVLEAKAVLADEPNRLDTRVLLAEALWRAGRPNEARPVCEAILRDSPDCLKANLILGQCLLQLDARNGHHNGHAEEGLRLLRRTVALDPESRIAGELFDLVPMPEALQNVVADLPALPPEDELMSDTAAPATSAERIVAIERSPTVAPSSRSAEPRFSFPAETVDVGFGDELAAIRSGASDTEAEALSFDETQADLQAASDTESEALQLDETEAELLAASAPEAPFDVGDAAPEPTPAPESDVVRWLDGGNDPVAPGRAAEVSPPKPTVGSKAEGSMRPAGRQLVRKFDDPMLDPQWADLLSMEVSLDAESEARLHAALSEMGFDPSVAPGETNPASAPPVPAAANEEGWREVFTGQSGLFAALESPEGETTAPATADRPPNDADIRPTDESADGAASSDDRSTASDSLADAAPAQTDHHAEPADLPAQPPGPEPRLRPKSGQIPVAADYRAQLKVAYDLQQGGRIDAAIADYVQLIRSAPDLLDEIVENLKAIVFTAPDQAAAHRALGDAYMKCGRFQEAIDQYNWVLGQRHHAESMSGDADA